MKTVIDTMQHRANHSRGRVMAAAQMILLSLVLAFTPVAFADDTDMPGGLPANGETITVGAIDNDAGEAHGDNRDATANRTDTGEAGDIPEVEAVQGNASDDRAETDDGNAPDSGKINDDNAPDSGEINESNAPDSGKINDSGTPAGGGTVDDDTSGNGTIYDGGTSDDNKINDGDGTGDDRAIVGGDDSVKYNNLAIDSRSDAQGGTSRQKAPGRVSVQSVDDISVYVGSTLIWEGGSASGVVPGITVISSGGTLTINASAGNYAGLSVIGGDSSDNVALNINGTVSFTGDAGNIPSPPHDFAGVSGITSEAAALTISGSGPLNVTADQNNPDPTGSDTGYPGIAANSDLTINNVAVVTKGSQQNQAGIVAGCGILAVGNLTLNSWGSGVTAIAGNNSDTGAGSDGGAGIDAFQKVFINGVVSVTGGSGASGGPGLVAYDYNAIMAETAVDTALTLVSGSLTATGGNGDNGSGGAGVLTPYSVNINNGASISGTGGVGATFGGTGIAAATPIVGVQNTPDPGNGIVSNNGGAITGKGGDAGAGDGYGGAGIETSVLSITGGSGVTGTGGDGAGGGIGGPGVLASSSISVTGISVDTGAQLYGDGGDGGTDGDGGAGIASNADITASNGARLTGVGGKGNGTGNGGTGVASSGDIDAAGGSNINGSGGAGGATGGEGGKGVATGVKNAAGASEEPATNPGGIINGDDSGVTGTGGSGGGEGSGGTGISIGSGSSSPAISAINGTMIKGIGGNGGSSGGKGGDGINTGGDVRPQGAPAIKINGGSTVTGGGGTGGGGESNPGGAGGNGGSGGAGVNTGGGTVDNGGDSDITGTGGEGGSGGEGGTTGGAGGDGGGGVSTGGGDVTNTGTETGTGGDGGDGGEGGATGGDGGNGGEGVSTGGGDVTNTGTETGAGGDGGNGGAGDTTGGAGGDGGGGVSTGSGDVTNTGTETGTGGEGGDGGNGGSQGGDGGNGGDGINTDDPSNPTGGGDINTSGSSTNTGGAGGDGGDGTGSGGSGGNGGNGGTGVSTGGGNISGTSDTPGSIGVGGAGGSGGSGNGGSNGANGTTGLGIDTGDGKEASIVTIAYGIRADDSAKGSLASKAQDSFGVTGHSTVNVKAPDVIDTPNDGYVFTGWDQTFPEYYPAANMVIYAVFKVDANNNGIPDDIETKITITFAVSGADSAKGSIETSQTYEFKGLVALPTSGVIPPGVKANNGYVFRGWSTAVPAAYPNSDLIIYATFGVADDNNNDNNGGNNGGNNGNDNDNNDTGGGNDGNGGNGGNDTGGSPGTGDEFPIGLLVVIAAFSAAAIPLCAAALRRSRRFKSQAP
jgi:hypothetical protein